MATERFELRLDEDLLGRVDDWRDDVGISTRAEAIRQLVEKGLRQAEVGDVIRFTSGEKMVISMLRDIYKSLDIKDGDIDPDFVAEAIWGGHSWALKWELTGLYHDHEDSPTVVRETASVLDMWAFLERGYNALSAKSKARLKGELGSWGDRIQFPGFDGNNEGEHYSVARMFIDKMDRWTLFKGRDLNSHAPLLSNYRKMLRIFEPARQKIMGDELNEQQIMEIMKAGFASP